jgi:hypothetical protein
MKVDHAKHDVESTFQKVGQDFFNAGSDALDRFVSGITKAYVQRYSQEAQEAFREGARGNASQWEAMFGKGGSLIRASGGLSKRSSADLYSQLSGAGDIGRLREAGYYVGGSDTAGQLKYANEVARGARSMDSSLFMQGKEKRDDIREAMARGQISGRGLDLVRSTEQFMLESMGGDKAAIHQAQRLMEGTVGGYDRGRRAKSYLAGAQVSTGSDFAVPELNMEYLMNGMNGRTLRERGELIGRSVFGNKESFGEENYGLRSGNKWNPADALKVGASAAYRGLADLVGYDPLQSKHRDAGMFMDSTDGRGLMRDMFSDDESKRKTAFEKNTDRRIELQRAMSNGTKLSDAEKGELQARGALADASRIRDEVAKGKSPEEAAAEIAKKVKGFDAKQALNAYHGSRAVASQEAIDQVRQVARDIGKEGRAARDELKASGGLSENENNGGLEMSDALRKTLAGNDQLRNYVEDRIAGINKSVEAGNATDDLGRYEATTEAMNFEGGARKRLRTMSTADLKAGAAKLAEAGAGALASDMSRQARRQSRFEKDLQRGGLSAVTNALGIELDDETKKGLRGKSAEEQARTILEQQGITDNASIYSLTSAISGQYGKGKDASKITSGERLAQLDNVLKPLQEAKKKDKEANDRQSNPLLAKVADGIDAMSKGIKITETVQIKAAEPLRVTVEKP